MCKGWSGVGDFGFQVSENLGVSLWHLDVPPLELNQISMTSQYLKISVSLTCTIYIIIMLNTYYFFLECWSEMNTLLFKNSLYSFVNLFTYLNTYPHSSKRIYSDKLLEMKKCFDCYWRWIYYQKFIIYLKPDPLICPLFNCISFRNISSLFIDIS